MSWTYSCTQICDLGNNSSFPALGHIYDRLHVVLKYWKLLLLPAAEAKSQSVQISNILDPVCCQKLLWMEPIHCLVHCDLSGSNIVGRLLSTPKPCATKP